MADLTYMDCWHYIAPLIPITSDRMTTEIYVMVFQALKEAEERRKDNEGSGGEEEGQWLNLSNGRRPLTQ